MQDRSSIAMTMYLQVFFHFVVYNTSISVYTYIIANVEHGSWTNSIAR